MSESWHELQAKVVEWAEDRWPDSNEVSKGRKLIEEASEYMEAAAEYRIDPERHAAWLLEEAADAQLVLLHIWHMLGFSEELGFDRMLDHMEEIWESKKQRAKR